MPTFLGHLTREQLVALVRRVQEIVAENPTSSHSSDGLFLADKYLRIKETVTDPDWSDLSPTCRHNCMRVKAVLTITVWVDGAENEKEVSDQLTWAADNMAAKGHLVGEGPATVNTWDAKVTTQMIKE